jgi:hypothetical protein
LAHNDQPDYEKYYQLAKWFFGPPEQVEKYIRQYGTLQDFVEFHERLIPLVERDERRQWLRKTVWDFFKVFAAIGAGILAMSGGVAAMRSLFLWLGQ